VDQKKEVILGEEENMVDSMNLTLSEQLFRLRDYFPDKIVASALELICLQSLRVCQFIP